MTSPEALLDAAVAAARDGGRVIRAAGPVRLTGHKSSATDPVTEIDLASEAAVVASLAASRPHDAVFGEEGTARAGTSGLRWVVDPVDGTTNLLYGSPHVTVSVAGEEQLPDGSWRAVVGVVHDPYRSETFTAVRGRGARLNGDPLRVNDPVSLDRALVTTGFAYTSQARARQARTLAGLLHQVRDIRSHGSAALELCWLAAGRCDAYYEDELAPWDFAAGALVAAEAGATVTALGSGVLAAGPALHPELTVVLERTAHVPVPR
ncbi:inositol monophosphatase family protein [Actinoplanes xinjiangensis]|uniref:Inositol-1-monophosphatase n=1 Tax=Actinoplanes xinjiangensis TaxID=512350 RepID=A0A316F323_9ACTN|nr:inositol monophosphatase family protein [Actinoplanes xinjiangensis]PWK30658.1 myo-inositol-1(or 4)-monophosphatase [Actinoplanes xinjiangensis]GIF44345.1 inositol monophosphatase [Actinoplanes xinjiangensis]